MDQAEKIQRLPLAREIHDLVDFTKIALPDVALHCERTGQLAYDFARFLGFAEQEALVAEAAGCLHDIGKLFVPRYILYKPSSLTSSERTKMMLHVTLGSSYVFAHERHERLALIVEQHHEHHNGRGYPNAMHGPQLDPLSGIISIVDSFCAMTENRTYSGAVTTEAACREVIAHAGRQFEPEYAHAFVRFMESSWSKLHVLR